MSLENFIFVLVIFVLLFIIDYFILNSYLNIINDNEKKDNKEKKEKKDCMEVIYLSGKFKISKDKLYKRKYIVLFALINSLIITITSDVMYLLPFKYAMKLVLSFAILFGLIYSLYEIVGRYICKREGNDGK